MKPPETEVCVDKPSCGDHQILADNVNIVSSTLPGQEAPEILPLLSDGEKERHQEPVYTWKIAGFTTCTASCLGGDHHIPSLYSVLELYWILQDYKSP